MSFQIEVTKNLKPAGALLVEQKNLKELPEPLKKEWQTQIEAGDPFVVPTLSLIEQRGLAGCRLSGSKDVVQLRRKFGRLAKMINRFGSLQWQLPAKFRAEHLKTALIGLSQGAYSFEKYKTKKSTCLSAVKLLSLPAAQKKVVREAEVYAESIRLCRDWINTPAEDMGPEHFVTEARAAGKGTGLKFKVMSEKECEKAGMGALLAVGRASHRRPRMLIVEWQGSKNKSFSALCGKGVCFDTGGLDIKPAMGMLLMRKDMGGAATVMAAMRTLALLKTKKNVKAYIPLVENAMGPDAFRPGDILKACDGQTIEVGHTDAEGRLILADAIATAKKQGAKEIISVATLTGAAMVALGRIHVPIMGDSNIIGRLQKAAQNSGEKVWQLPMDEDHRALVRGRSADLTNSDGSGEAGCITAGAFLWHFAGDVPFAHCDISPACWKTSSHDLGPAGATGVFVSTLVGTFH